MGREEISQRGDTMRRVRKTLIPLLLMTSVFATSVLAAPSLNDQKEQAEQEVRSLQAELTELMTEINLTEQKLIETGEAVIAATERLEEAEEQEQQQHDDMVKRIVAMYETGNSSTLQILMESGSIADMLQNLENVQAIHDYDRKALDEYVAVKEEIAELKVTLEEEKASLEDLQAQLTKKEKSLNNKISAKKAEVEDLEEQIAEAARKAAEEAERKRREEERKRQEEEAKKNQQTIIGNNNNSSSSGGRDYTGTGDQSVGDAIVAAARTYLGVDYVWGGNGYNGIDCSGLTKAAHKAVGITIDRWSGHQAIGGKKINSLAEALPGDIICYSGHVAIYIGNYRVIHAPHTGDVVKEATVYLKEIIAIRRYW